MPGRMNSFVRVLPSRGLRNLGISFVSFILVWSVLTWPSPAYAGAGAAAVGNSVSVGVSASSAGNGSQGSNSARSSGSHSTGWTQPAPTPAITCQLVAIADQSSEALGVGGPTPGQWFLSSCSDNATHGPRGGLVWIPTSPGAPAGLADPLALAQQAESSITLPGPTIRTNPASYSVVNFPTWLWVDPANWHPFAASATAGTVTATAVATPTSVTWSMGDGGTVVCNGPGTPYDTTRPSSEQQTDCSYTYRQSSAGQPSSDGDPNAGAYPVTATIVWAVAWTVTGAPGGGALPVLQTTSTTPVRVEQVESVDTAS